MQLPNPVKIDQYQPCFISHRLATIARTDLQTHPRSFGSMFSSWNASYRNIFNRLLERKC